MRISTSQVFMSNLDNISRNNTDLFKTQQQLSTGKNVLQPSDDPLAAAQIIKLKKEIARNDQFQGNIDVSQRRLEQEEIALDQLNNINIRLREITIKAGSEVLTAADRKSLAVEVDEMTQQMLGLMNTKDVQGEYLFSGYKGDTAAYAYDETSEQYVFQGDSGQRLIQVGPDNRIASTDSGQKLFEQIQAPEQPYVSNNPEGVLNGVSLVNRDKLEEVMADKELPLDITVQDTSTVPPTLLIEDAAGTVLFDNSADPTDPQNQLGNELGISLGINPSVPPAPTGPFSAEVDLRAEKTNPLNIALKLQEGLEDLDLSDPEQKEAFRTLIADTLDTLTQAEESNIQARTSLGARINALEQQETVNTDYQLFTKETLSSFEDLDYAEAISRFALQQNVLGAAYQSFSKIKEMTLFNYLR